MPQPTGLPLQALASLTASQELFPTEVNTQQQLVMWKMVFLSWTDRELQPRTKQPFHPSGSGASSLTNSQGQKCFRSMAFQTDKWFVCFLLPSFLLIFRGVTLPSPLLSSNRGATHHFLRHMHVI